MGNRITKRKRSLNAYSWRKTFKPHKIKDVLKYKIDI